MSKDKEQGEGQSNLSSGASKKSGFTPVHEDVPLADESALKNYHKTLRHFFKSGKKTGEGLAEQVSPLIFTPYLRGASPDAQYPVLWPEDGPHVQSVHAVLNEVFSETFAPDDAPFLEQHLPDLEELMHDQFNKKTVEPGFHECATQALKALQESVGKEEAGAGFSKQCKQFSSALRKKSGILKGYSDHLPFQILNLQLKARQKHNLAFQNTLENNVAGLHDLLARYGLRGQANGAAEKTSDFEFADQMISFDKLSELTPHGKASDIPEQRQKRIQHCLQVLTKATNSLAHHQSQVFVSKSLADEFSLEQILEAVTFHHTTDSACGQAKAHFNIAIRDFVEVIASLRIAALEIQHAYDEDLHTAYFETFNQVQLSTEEISFLAPIIVIAEQTAVMHHSEDFLELLIENIPVRIMAINKLGDATEQHDEARVFHQDLGALAFSQRNAFIFQGAADRPSALANAFNEGLRAPSPVLWSVLCAEPGLADPYRHQLRLHAAVESRYFPRFKYDITAGERFGSRFDISGNTQAEQSFVAVSVDTRKTSGTQPVTYRLTVADYFALDATDLDKLEIVPPAYCNDDLIPLAEYLHEPQEKLIGKVPVVPMVNADDIIRQAAVPFTWVSRCKERLDHWQFIQELGGVNSFHVQQAVLKARSEWEAEKALEVANLTSALQAEAERIRIAEAGRTIERLVNALLDPDSVVPTPTIDAATDQASPAQPVVASQTAAKQEAPKSQKSAPQPKEEEREVSSEVWVESFRCTTCNDCTDALPAVFKYNEDKQAVVHNPKGGTYAKIVIVAEKCPAKCIHPGLPQNPDEKGLDKLMKRAEKLN